MVDLKQVIKLTDGAQHNTREIRCRAWAPFAWGKIPKGKWNFTKRNPRTGKSTETLENIGLGESKGKKMGASSSISKI